MRSFSFVLLMLAAVSANAEERTWTISTGTYTVAAELVEVRGDIAYLKIGDKVEHIPFARLSGADQLYVASQSRPRVFPGPSEDRVVEESLPGPQSELNALPPGGAITDQQGPALSITAKKPPIEPVPAQQTESRGAIRSNYIEELPPVPTAEVPKSRSLKADPRAVNNSNSNPYARRPAQLQKQNQNNNTSNQNRSRDEERRGLFGARARRLGNDR